MSINRPYGPAAAPAILPNHDEANGPVAPPNNNAVMADLFQGMVQAMQQQMNNVPQIPQVAQALEAPQAALAPEPQTPPNQGIPQQNTPPAIQQPYQPPPEDLDQLQGLAQLQASFRKTRRRLLGG